MLSTPSPSPHQNLPSSAKSPHRILQVVGAMEQGGLETWLMRVLREIDRDRFQIDFLVSTSKPCPYDDEIRQFGSQVIPCLDPHRPWVYGSHFKRILRQHGPYDIVHSHLHHYSGYILWLAKQAGVPIRIAHSHLDASYEEAKSSVLRRLYLNLMRGWIARCATTGLGCSREAAVDLFGADWQSDPRWQILYCGIDLSPFQRWGDGAAVRAELGIPTDAFVIGHVGRFAEQKNHRFLVEIAAEVLARQPNTYLLLVGKGTLRSAIEQQVAQLGFANRVIFAENRSDVPRLLQGAMDVFLMPSLYEGLPVAGIEAQAAKLPLILSDSISREVEIVKPLVRFVSLSQPASVWADAVLEAHRTRANFAALEGGLESSPFNIAYGVKMLEKIYVDR